MFGGWGGGVEGGWLVTGARNKQHMITLKSDTLVSASLTSNLPRAINCYFPCPSGG